MSEELLKAGLAKLFLGLDYLHSECKIVHTDNIMMELVDESVLEAFTQSEMDDPSPRKLVDGTPIYASRQFGRPKKFGDVVLGDFGAAFRGDQKRNHDAQPNVYRSPEVMLKTEWSYPVDIWNVGVMIWDLFEGRHLFHGNDPKENRYLTRAHLAELVALLGPPPPDLLQRGQRSSEFFTEDGTVSDLYSQSPPPNRLIVSQMVSDMGPDVISELLCEFMTNIPVIQSTIMKKYAEVLDAARKAREAAEEATRKAQEKSAAAAQKREQAKIRKAQTQVVSFENYSNKAFNMLNKDHGNSSYSNEHAAGLRASSSIEKMFRTMVDKMDQPTTWGTRFNAIETMREIFDHLCGANPGIVPRACRNDMYDWDREFMRGFNKLTAPEMSILAISSNGKWLRSFEGTVAELKKYCIEGSLPGALQRLQSYVDPGSGPAAAVDDPLQV
ncbi:hypothetical protein ACHAQA_007561 [Verticillium albo-atrum]